MHYLTPNSYQGTSCEIGRVSPLYGFLDENMSKSVDSKLGFVLAGCSGNCESKNVVFVRFF